MGTQTSKLRVRLSLRTLTGARLERGAEDTLGHRLPHCTSVNPGTHCDHATDHLGPSPPHDAPLERDRPHCASHLRGARPPDPQGQLLSLPLDREAKARPRRPPAPAPPSRRRPGPGNRPRKCRREPPLSTSLEERNAA